MTLGMPLNQENVKILNFNNKELNSSLILSSPHSGGYYPNDFLLLSQVSSLELSQNEDSLVDELFKLPAGIKNVLLKAIWSRSVVDVNRSINDFLKNDFNPNIKKIASKPSKYALSGLGVIPTRSGINENIYKSFIPGDVASKWLETAWRSYHDNLNFLLNKAYEQFDNYILLDFHSMPSSIKPENQESDIVLGDCNGKTVKPNIIDFIENYFKKNGLKVNRNNPYSGGYITQNYGNPIKNCHSLQIEINRSLYLNEKTRNKNLNFYNCQKLLTNLINTFDENKHKLLM